MAAEQDNDCLRFFNQLWGRLNIDLSEPAHTNLRGADQPGGGAVCTA